MNSLHLMASAMCIGDDAITSIMSSPTLSPLFHTLPFAMQALISDDTLESWARVRAYVKDLQEISRARSARNSARRRSMDSSFINCMANYNGTEEEILRKWSGSALDWERLEEVHTRRIEREDRQREALAERTQLDEEWQATDSGLHWAELLTIQHTTDTHNNRTI